MFEEIGRFTEQNGMIKRGDRIVAGISGGADSVCLLLFLESLREEFALEIFAVHVNHGIRGEEADRDEEFTKALCARLDIPCAVVKRDVMALAGSSGRSAEEEGRIVRYEAFEEECGKRSASKIAVAHNLSDNAETVLHNLVRGTGLHGLCGIRPVTVRKSGITVIRPLLCLEKKEIVEILDSLGERYCTDSTNRDDDYSRNYIRNNILPSLEGRLNPKASLHIAQAAQMLAQTEDYIFVEKTRVMRELEAKGAVRIGKRDAESGRAEVSFAAKELEGLHPLIAKEIVRDLIEKAAGKLKDITSAHIEDVLGLAGMQSGKSLNLPYGVCARNDFGRITLTGADYKAEGGTCDGEALSGPSGAGGRTIEYVIKPYDIDKTIPKNDCIKWFDYDKIIGSVEVRTARDGDYIKVRKQGADELGRKAVRDVLMELKVPVPVRDRVPLLASGSHVLWIGGMRGTDDFRVDSGTKRILEARLTECGRARK